VSRGERLGANFVPIDPQPAKPARSVLDAVQSDTSGASPRRARKAGLAVELAEHPGHPEQLLGFPTTAQHGLERFIGTAAIPPKEVSPSEG
jgi:hypothetical protein